MNLSILPKTTKRSKKRVGRGYGSGKGGHTAGRGTKGQKSRSKVSIEFDGTARGGGFYKRMPFLRGKGKLKPRQNKPYGINVKYLSVFKKNANVTVDSLIKHNIVDASVRSTGVKVLGDGDIMIPLTVHVPTTKSAQKKIEKAGGVVEKQ